MVRNFIVNHPKGFIRFFSILIPLTSWFIILLPFWMSFWHPAIVAYFVIIFIIYWFYKSAVMGISALRSYLTLSGHVRVDWRSLVTTHPNCKDIKHLVIIPEYKEPYQVLSDTISSISKQDFPTKQIFVCLATESRDTYALDTFKRLKKEYKDNFADFFMTKHTLLHGEVAGKSSNMGYAARESVHYFKSKQIDISLMTVTSCDSDVQLHPKYFSYLSYTFLHDSYRNYHFYQAAILFYSNIWKIPLPGRVINSIGSIVNLAMLSQGKKLVNVSTYSLALQTAKEVGYWSCDVIPEDWHMFYKTYFNKGEHVSVVPIYLPALSQAPLSNGLVKTLQNQYEQNKRWAWGVSDVPHVMYQYALDTKIPFWEKTTRLFHLLEWHIIWPTNWFILTLGAVLPVYLNKNFAKTALGHNLAQVSSAILTFCLVFLLIIIILDIKSRPPRPKDYSKWKIPILYAQWITLPIVSFFLSALPGLDAHTRLLFGKKLEYRVTEKT